jgi:hypothetical protein
MDLHEVIIREDYRDLLAALIELDQGSRHRSADDRSHLLALASGALRGVILGRASPGTAALVIRAALAEVDR